MRHGYSNAVLFSRRDDHKKLSALCSRAIVTLSALWRGVPHRNPFIDGSFATSHRKPERSAFAQEEIAHKTGYLLSRFRDVQVVGRNQNGEERVRPDLVSLCGRWRKPAFVTLDEVGYDDPEFFGEGMALAAELVGSGYYGCINCYSNCSSDDKFENPERCLISISEDGLFGVRIHWGDDLLVGPLLDFCRAEGLTEEDGRQPWEKAA